MTGKIYGIGVGIGDPEDITLKAVRLIKESDVLICPQEDLDRCRAYQIAKKSVPEIEDIKTISFEFEMVKDKTIREYNHRKIYEEVKELVKAGKTVSFLTIGDPALYSTYSYIADLAKSDGIQTFSASGISSLTASANSLGIPLCEKGDQLHVISELNDIEAGLTLPGTKVIMKCGKDIVRIKELLRKKTGILVYAVSECGTKNEKSYIGLENIPDEGNYMLTILVKEDVKKNRPY